MIPFFTYCRTSSFCSKERRGLDTCTAKEHSSSNHSPCYNQFYLILLLLIYAFLVGEETTLVFEANIGSFSSVSLATKRLLPPLYSVMPFFTNKYISFLMFPSCLSQDAIVGSAIPFEIKIFFNSRPNELAVSVSQHGGCRNPLM